MCFKGSEKNSNFAFILYFRSMTLTNVLTDKLLRGCATKKIGLSAIKTIRNRGKRNLEKPKIRSF